MSERLPLHYFTEPIHADMRYEEPDALSIHWLARYAIKSRDNPELLEKITEELAQVLSERLFDDALFDLWVSHAPGCAFEKGGLSISRDGTCCIRDNKALNECSHEAYQKFD
jgi:hypothetical protein